MSVFDSLGETADKATDTGEKFLKTSHQYFKLKVFQQITFSISMIAKLIAIGSFVFIGFIFGAVAGAIALGNTLESMSLGYLLVGLMFILIGVIIYVNRSFINKIVLEKLGSKFFSEDD